MLLNIWEDSAITARDFAYWLQGLFELSNPKELNEKQTDLIKRHLNMVFYHEIDPSMGGKDHQGKLTALHEGLNISNFSQGCQEVHLQEHPDTTIGTMDLKLNSTAKPSWMTMSEEELDEKFGKGIRPRC